MHLKRMGAAKALPVEQLVPRPPARIDVKFAAAAVELQRPTDRRGQRRRAAGHDARKRLARQLALGHKNHRLWVAAGAAQQPEAPLLWRGSRRADLRRPAATSEAACLPTSAVRSTQGARKAGRAEPRSPGSATPQLGSRLPGPKHSPGAARQREQSSGLPVGMPRPPPAPAAAGGTAAAAAAPQRPPLPTCRAAARGGQAVGVAARPPASRRGSASARAAGGALTCQPPRGCCITRPASSTACTPGSRLTSVLAGLASS